MNSLNINNEGYSTPTGTDTENNWAAAFAKRVTGEHKCSPVLDHPDGSVTPEKLSDGLRARISEAYETAQTASETANTAKDVAQSAKASADIAVKESENAYEKSLAAHEKASVAENIANTAKNKSETAEQRSASAEAKADTAVAAAGSAVQKAETVHGNLEEHINNSDIHTSAEEKNTWNNKAEKDHTHDDYATHEVVSNSTYIVYQLMINDINHLQSQIDEKANKPSVFTYSYPSHEYEFNYMYNHDIRNGELTTLSFTFGNGEYQPDYISGLSFDSGETPTAIDYTDSGILNWIGTDCVTSDGLSIFQPSANTHYDIVFYFNGKQFIGLVNGFVPATGNEAV